jgi:excisionase family DNA binding protein
MPERINTPLSAANVAEILGISATTVVRLARSGELPAKREAGKYVFEFDAIIKRCEELEGAAA